MLSHIVPKILSLDNTSQKDATRRKGYTVQSLKEHIILVLLSVSLPFLPEHVSRLYTFVLFFYLNFPYDTPSISTSKNWGKKLMHVGNLSSFDKSI